MSSLKKAQYIWKSMLLSSSYAPTTLEDRRRTTAVPVPLDRRAQDRRRGSLHLFGPGKMPPEIKMAA